MQAEYRFLADKLGNYVVKLLDKVHGNDELNTVLNAASSDDSDEQDDDDDVIDGGVTGGGSLARLHLAILYKEKQVGRLLTENDSVHD